MKPLGRQLKGIRRFAGAAIMGDGLVALILDVMGLAQEASIISDKPRAQVVEKVADEERTASRKEALLLIGTGGNGRAAIELSMVARLEEFDPDRLERTAGQEVVQYRDAIMPIVRLAAVLGDGGGRAAGERLPVVVVNSGNGGRVGLAVDSILDIIEVELNVVRHSAQQGIRGAATVQGRVTDLLDVNRILVDAVPGFLEAADTAPEAV